MERHSWPTGTHCDYSCPICVSLEVRFVGWSWHDVLNRRQRLLDVYKDARRRRTEEKSRMAKARRSSLLPHDSLQSQVNNDMQLRTRGFTGVVRARYLIIHENNWKWRLWTTCRARDLFEGVPHSAMGIVRTFLACGACLCRWHGTPMHFYKVDGLFEVLVVATKFGETICIQLEFRQVGLRSSGWLPWLRQDASPCIAVHVIVKFMIFRRRVCANPAGCRLWDAALRR